MLLHRIVANGSPTAQKTARPKPSSLKDDSKVGFIPSTLEKNYLRLNT